MTLLQPHAHPAACRAHPTRRVLFGDNEQRRARAGQAVIRGEPNAVGVRTKAAPSMTDSAFWWFNPPVGSRA